jgi:hypothetical protein
MGTIIFMRMFPDQDPVDPGDDDDDEDVPIG